MTGRGFASLFMASIHPSVSPSIYSNRCLFLITVTVVAGACPRWSLGTSNVEGLAAANPSEAKTPLAISSPVNLM